MSSPSGRSSLAAPGGITVLFLCLALLVSVSIGHSAVREPERLRVLVPQTTAALPFLQIARDHAVQDADLQVELFSSHAQALALLLRGDADLLASGTSQGWESRQGGSPIVMIDTGVWGMASLVGRDASLRSFADLRGKRLALPFPGSPLDFQTRAILAHDKLDPDRDLTISYGPFSQSIARLLAGQLDAAALPEPVATEALKDGSLRRLEEYPRAWAAFHHGDRRSPQVSLFATERFASTHRPLLMDLVAAWGDASREISLRPAQAARRFAAVLGADPGLLAEATRRTLLEVPDPGENQSRVMDYYREVTPFLPDRDKPLDEQFFFIP